MGFKRSTLLSQMAAVALAAAGACPAIERPTARRGDRPEILPLSKQGGKHMAQWKGEIRRGKRR